MDKVEFFKTLDFTEYEARALASLIKLKSAAPKEISLDSTVPQNKLYSLFKNLEKKGVLALIPERIPKYKIINLKTYINEHIKKKEEGLRKIKEISKDISCLGENEEEFVFSIIKGQRAIMNKIAEANDKAQKEIVGIQRNWKVWGEGLRVMQNSIKREVKVRMIGVINDETKKRALEWKKTGCKIKAYNKMFGENPLRFTIFDNKEARLTIGKPEIPNPDNYLTIWTKSPALINTLRRQFESMWKECENF